MTSLSERIRELRGDLHQVSAELPTQLVAPQPVAATPDKADTDCVEVIGINNIRTFNAMSVEDIDMENPPLDKVASTQDCRRALAEVQETLVILNAKLDELIKRQKKIQAHVKKLREQ